MGTLVNRGLSLVVYCGYIVAAYHGAGGLVAAKLAIPLLLPMACIWFPDALGSYTGIMHYHAITAPTPGFLVSAGGWLLLVVVPFVVYVIWSGSPAT
jgi:uncharacterized membrane protein YoaT (DUF817 family)